jgi:hypothetical protein
MGDVMCEACGFDVPAGAYCGYCGADLTFSSVEGRGRLRRREYVVAPRENLFRFSLISTFFPHLLPRSRAPFRIGLAILIGVLLGCALGGWQAPVIAICVLGVPLLFGCYLREIRTEISIRLLLLTTGLGLLLGAVWGVVTGGIVAGDLDVSLRSGVGLGNLLLDGVVIPTGSAVLAVTPAVVLRFLRRSNRKLLHGFVFGSLGATAFTAATTLALLAPQLQDGPVISGRPVTELVVEAGLRGLVIPLTAMASGGLIGIALWSAKPAGRSGWAVLPAALFVLLVATSMGLLELIPVTDDIELLLHLMFPVLMMYGLRVTMQIALLHDRRQTSTVNPRLCGYCNHVVPGMTFCPSCGVAMCIAVRRIGAMDEGVEPHPGYALPARTYQAVPVRRIRLRNVVPVLAIGISVGCVLAVAVSINIAPDIARYRCPPDCGHPPMGKPVAANPRFTASNGEFSVSYPVASAAYEVDSDPNGVVLNYIAGDTGTMELFGQEAMGRNAKQIAEQLTRRNYPDATVAYELPNATVGYQSGYGVAMDFYPQNTDGRYTRLRLLVLVAVKNDYALIASAVGPYRKFGPDFGNGHPSAANLELALDMGQYVNSFRWRGDPPR